MALEVTFYPAIRQTSTGGVIPALQGADLGTQVVAVGAGSTNTTAAPAGTGFAALLTGEDCRVKVGVDANASRVLDATLSRKLLSGKEYLFACAAGERVSVTLPA